MVEAASREARTAPLVVLCATWEFALDYATTPGHSVKPRVAREDGPDGPQWAIHVQVPCGVAVNSEAAGSEQPPRATGVDPRAFWKLLRER